MTDKLFGRNVKGDPQTENSWPTQEDPQLLIDAIDKLPAIDGVLAVKWSQYTPGFNDGEPCRFGINSPEVKLAGVTTPEEYDEWEEDEDVFLGSYDLFTYAEKDGKVDFDKKIYEVQGIQTKEIRAALDELEAVLDSKAHHAWLLANFGDPATVVATETDFDVEYYEYQ